MRLQKFSLSIILGILISLFFNVIIQAQQATIESSISALNGKEQIDSSDFRKLAEEYKNGYNIYAICISSDDQHFPSSTIDMPKDIVSLRKEIKGSKLSETEIKKTYFSILQPYSTYFVKDKSGREFLLVIENKVKQASPKTGGNIQSFNIIIYIKYGFVAIASLGTAFLIYLTYKRYNIKHATPRIVKPEPRDEIKTVKLVGEYFTQNELTSNECVTRISLFIHTIEDMLSNIHSRITSARYYHEMNSPLNKDAADIIRISYKLNDEIRKHEDTYNNNSNKIRNINEELIKLNNYSDENYKTRQIMLIIQEVTLTYKKTQEQLICIEELIDSILDFKVKCLAGIIDGNNHLTLELNPTVLNIFAEQIKRYIDNMTGIVKKSLYSYGREQSELREHVVKLSKYIEDKNEQGESITKVYNMLDNKINSLVNQYESLSDKILSIGTSEADAQANRVLKEFYNIQNNINNVVKSISMKDSSLINKINSIGEQIAGIDIVELKDIFKALDEQKDQFEFMKAKITDLEKSITENNRFYREVMQLVDEGNKNVEIISNNFEENLVPYFKGATRSICITMFDFSSEKIIRQLNNVPWNVPIKIVMDREKGLERKRKFKDLYNRKNFELRGYKNKDGGLMHRKSTIIDSATTITGSLNFTFSAVEKEINDEHVIVLKNKLKADIFIKDFEELFNNSEAIKLI